MSGSRIHYLAGLFVIAALLSHCHVDANHGIIGSDDNLGNVLYVILYLAIVLGSFATKLTARGMRHVMYWTAFLQVAIPAFLFAPDFIWFGSYEGFPYQKTVILTMTFTIVWLLLSVLFLIAERNAQTLEV